MEANQKEKSAQTVTFGIRIDKQLSDALDTYAFQWHNQNRSKAVVFLLRHVLKNYLKGGDVIE